MKKLITVLFFAFGILSSANAQSAAEEVDLIQSIYGMEKKEMVKNFIKPDASKSDAFWTIYDQYEVERKENGKKRLKLLQDYANNYGTMSAEMMDETIKNIMTQRNTVNKTIDKYYKKIKKEVGSKEAAQFYQFENYLLSEIRVAIMDNIPFLIFL
jgi:hypothetical protein